MAWARMSDDEILEFSRGYVEGRIFTSFHIPPEDQEALLPQIFMPLAFGALDLLSEEDKGDVGALWAHMDDATPIEVEGYSVFAEMRVMHISDWKLAASLIHQMQHGRI